MDDPFASIGGGVQTADGGWIPKSMANPVDEEEKKKQQQVGAAPTAAPTSPDPFTSLGGGVYVNGGWIPKGMATPEQLAAQTAAAGPATPSAAPGGAPTTPGSPAATPIAEQAQKASTYSATPGAAPTATTTNQGTQDVVRNSYLARATQPVTVDPNDPTIRAQVDPFAAAQERARRQGLSEAAERASAQGLGDSGALDAERRLLTERAGQQTGLFESQLVGRELQTKRDEIADALVNLRGMLSGDQQAQLAKELAELDAALKRLGIETGAGTAGQELGLKRELGLGGLNLDLMQLLMQDRQFADTMGFNVADREAYWNNQALQDLIPRG